MARYSEDRVPRFNIYPLKHIWCPELIPEHRGSFYKFEVLLNKEHRYFTDAEREIIRLKKKPFCSFCRDTTLLSPDEREDLEIILAGVIRSIEEDEESLTPLKIKRGQSIEMYYGHDNHDQDNLNYSSYYGYGHPATENSRMVFWDLELKEFCENALSDKDAEPGIIFEKRRYVSEIIEIALGISELYQDPKEPRFGEREPTLVHMSFAFGFLLAEYKWKFKAEKNQHKRTVASGNSSKARAERRLEMFMKEIETLAPMFPTISKERILEQAFDNAISKDETLWREGKNQFENYLSNYLTSLEPYKSRFNSVFYKTT